LDLGSGRGNCVLLAASSGVFERCSGIELVPRLCQLAEAALSEYEAEVAPHQESPVDISFSCRNFLQLEDWPLATMIFITVTCIDHDKAVKARLVAELERQVVAGAVVCTLGGELRSPAFGVEQCSFAMDCSWGADTVWIYRRS
jgi:hypothetical protein